MGKHPNAKGAGRGRGRGGGSRGGGRLAARYEAYQQDSWKPDSVVEDSPEDSSDPDDDDDDDEQEEDSDDASSHSEGRNSIDGGSDVDTIEMPVAMWVSCLSLSHRLPTARLLTYLLHLIHLAGL